MKKQNLLFGLVLSAVCASAAHAQDFEIKQNDFKTLFNQVRMGQPEIAPWPGTYWPYSFYGTGANVEQGQFTQSKTRGENPMTIFDSIAGQKGKKTAYKWEIDTHNCDNVDKETKEGCVNWWGHCNGWSAAAIKEDEPRNEFTVNGQRITTATAKGIFSEVWLSSNSLFSGNTDKETKTQDGLKPGGWIDKVGDETYNSFWDVSPRTFFLIATNYMGLAKMGFVIDRFTGEEVWNQPVVGYRVLPIEAAGIRVENRNSRQVWAVPMKMKIYWGNDLDTPPGVVSKGFDITKDSNDTARLERLPTASNGERAYEGRILEFTLFFDREVKVSDDGKQVLSAGRIVGDGIWKMQENPRQYTADQLNQSHPDFVWMPTNWVLDSTNGYGNPYLDEDSVEAVFAANKEANAVGAAGARQPAPARPQSGAAKAWSSFKMTFSREAFANLNRVDLESVRRKLRRLFARGNMRASMPSEDFIVNGNTVSLRTDVPPGTTRDDLNALFTDAEVPVRAITPVAD